MLELRALTKTVPGGRVLFAGLHFTLAAGEFVAIMGESGVGKSTLLNLIAGLDAVDSGQVLVDGVDLATLSDDARTRLRRNRIGFVFQASHVLPHLTLAQNIALPLVLQGVAAVEARERVLAMLDAIGLAGRGDEFPRVLSGGELQRVAIARALIHRPALLLLDEPTGNLDPDTAARVLALVEARLADQSTATLLVTHSQLAAAAADRVMRLTREGLVER